MNITIMKINPNNTQFWDNKRNRITSGVGVWRGGEDVFFQGYSMKDDLIGKKSYMQIIILNATGRLVEKSFSDWLEGNFIGLSYPDSRIWCNQIAALLATNGVSPTAASAAAILAADSRAYGGSYTSQVGIEQLSEIKSKYQDNQSFEQSLSHCNRRNGKPMINGFARPVDKDDERIAIYESLRKQLSIDIGEHLAFALQLSDYLQSKFGLAVNSGGYANAMFLDHGFSGEEAARIKAAAVLSGAIACFRDNQNMRTEFLPMKCKDIEYKGPKPRPLV